MLTASDLYAMGYDEHVGSRCQPWDVLLPPGGVGTGDAPLITGAAQPWIVLVDTPHASECWLAVLGDRIEVVPITTFQLRRYQWTSYRLPTPEPPPWWANDNATLAHVQDELAAYLPPGWLP